MYSKFLNFSQSPENRKAEKKKQRMREKPLKNMYLKQDEEKNRWEATQRERKKDARRVGRSSLQISMSFIC